MNRRQVLFAGPLGMMLLARRNLSAAAGQPQDEAWTAALPETVTFERIADPTAEDRARISMLALVTRSTWGSEANLSGTCFDFFTGSPVFTIVEDGVLRVSVFEPQEPATTLDLLIPPTVF